MLALLLSFSLTLSSQCVVNHLEWASSVEITKPFNLRVSSLKASKRYLEKLYDSVMEKHGEYDPRFFALAWMEGRLRRNVRRGDRGKACGPFQIHARHSYPMFRRKRGYNGWDEKENRLNIARECAKLSRVEYSVETLSRYLKIFDDRDLPVCHHNSGVYGKCDEWYDQRVSYWEGYFALVGLLCSVQGEG